MDSRVQDLATKQDLALLENTLGRKIEILEERANGRFTLLQWMVGFNLAATVALLWMMFKLLSA